VALLGLFVTLADWPAVAQQPAVTLDPKNFTGKVGLTDVSDMRTLRIRFEAGARTNWHVHSHDQLLLVEEGRGLIQTRGGPVREMVPGQPVFAPPGVPHWHGAAPERAMVQLTIYSGTVTWMEPVTGAQYSATVQR
jgi:quercetin dioxygenase-like cupin family protein